MRRPLAENTLRRLAKGVRKFIIDHPDPFILPSGAIGHLAVAYLAQQNGGFNETPGHSPTKPMTTITNTGSQQQLVTAHLANPAALAWARTIGLSIQTCRRSASWLSTEE